MTSQTKRMLCVGTLACLAPMVVGIALYRRLPDPMPIHFGLSGEPDNWGPKWFAVLGLPVIMAALEALCIIVSERAIPEGEARPRLLTITYWFVPIIGCVCYLLTLRAGLGQTSFIGKVVCALVGLMLVLMGNYLPKMSFASARAVHNRPLRYPKFGDEATFHRQSRRWGIALMVLGMLFLGLALVA